MRSKTKYFIIALLFALIAFTGVGVSKWNIHIQQQFNDPFKAVDHVTADPIIGRYIRIQNAETEEVLPGEANLIYNGKPYTVTVTDNGNGGEADASTWTEWQATGLTFTYSYTGTTASGATYSSENAPKDAGSYTCKITAVAGGSDASAKTAAKELNIYTASDGSNYAAEISFAINQKEGAITGNITSGDKATAANLSAVYSNNATIPQSACADSPLYTKGPNMGAATANLAANAGINASNLAETAGTTRATDPLSIYFEPTISEADKLSSLFVPQKDGNNLPYYDAKYNGATKQLTLDAEFETGVVVAADVDTTEIEFEFKDADGKAITDLTNASNDKIYTATAKSTNPNYKVINYEFRFKIVQRIITVTIATDHTSVYGDPIQNYNYTGSDLASGDDIKDIVSITVKNASGEVVTLSNTSDAGTYTMEGAQKDDNQTAKNYSVTTITEGRYEITKRPLKVTIDNTTSVYGDPIAALTCTGDNLVNSDDIYDIVSLSTTAAPDADGRHKDVGSSYTITGTQKSDNQTAKNYNVTSFTNGTYTITPRPVTLTWETDLVYNRTAQAPTTTAGNLVNGDNITVTVNGAQTNANAGTDGTLLSGKSDYTATATALNGDKAANYKLPDDKTTNFVIKQRPIKITIQDKSSVYGEEIVGLTCTGSNIIDGDWPYDVVSLSTTATAASPVGTYPITGTKKTGSVADNYFAEFTNGTYSITRREVTLTWNNTTLTYNGRAQTPAAEITSGLLRGDTVTVTVSGAQTNANASKDGTLLSGKSDYTATASLDGDKAGNYTITNNTTNFTIKQAILTVTAENKETTYSEASPEFTVTYSGFVNGENESVLKGTLSFTCAYDPNATDANKNAGTYTITPSGLTAQNYEITFATGTLTVNKKQITLAWNPLNDKHDDGTPVFKFDGTTKHKYTPYVEGIDSEFEELAKVGVLKITGNNAIDSYPALPWVNSLDTSGPKVNGIPERAKCSVEVKITDTTNYTWADDSDNTTSKLHEWYIYRQIIKVYIHDAEHVYGNNQESYYEIKENTTIQYVNEADLNRILGLYNNNNSKELNINYDSVGEYPIKALSADDYTVKYNGGYLRILVDNAGNELTTIPDPLATYTVKPRNLTITLRDDKLNYAEHSYIYFQETWGPFDTTDGLATGDSILEVLQVSINGEYYNEEHFFGPPAGTHKVWCYLEYGITDKAKNYLITVTGVDGVTADLKSLNLDHNNQSNIDAANAILKNATATLTIEPYPVTITWTGENFTYNGDPHAPTAEYTCEPVTVEGFTVSPVDMEAEQMSGEVIVRYTYYDAKGTEIGGMPSAVGTYKAKAYLYLTRTNYDGTTEDIHLTSYNLDPDNKGADETTFTITKAPVTAPTADTTVFTYNGTKQTYNPNGFDPATMTIKGNEQTNAGKYTVTVSLNDNNHQWSDGTTDAKTFEFTIKKKALSFSWHNTDLTYNGQPQQPTAEIQSGLVEGDDVSVTVSVEGEHTNANADKDGTLLDGKEYYVANVVLSGNDKDNYSIGRPCNFTIKKATIDLSGFAPVWGCFDGETVVSFTGNTANYTGHELTVKITNLDSKLQATYTDNTGTNEGAHNTTAIISVHPDYAANYQISGNDSYTLAWSITSITTVAVPTNGNTYIYSGSDQYSTILGGFSGYDAEIMTVNVIDCTNAGEYTFTFTLKDTASYAWDTSTLPQGTTISADGATASVTVTIEKASFDMSAVKWVMDNNESLTNFTVTYDGNAHSVVLNGLPEGLTANYTNNSTNTTTATNAGDYTASVSSFTFDSANYNEPAAIADQAWSISPCGVTLAWANVDSRTYDGTNKLPTATYTDINGATANATVSVKMGSNTVTEVKNAGDYTATASVSSNYAITGGTEKTFTINKLAINITIDNATHVYGSDPAALTCSTTNAVANADGLDNIVTLTVKNKTSGATVTLSKTTNAGTYNIIGSQKTSGVALNYTVAFTNGEYTVTKATLTATLTVVAESPRAAGLIEHGDLLKRTCVVKDVNGKTLTGGTHYIVSYNTDTATYSGTADIKTQTISCTITPKDNYANNYNALVITCDITVSAVAKIDSTYYGTVESALAAATSGKTVYVLVGKNPLIRESCEIKSGVTLCLPLDDSGTWSKTGSNGGATDSSFSGKHAYEKGQLRASAVLAAGKTLTNNSKLNIGGQVTGGSGGGNAGFTVNEYSQLTLGKDATLNSPNGSIECYGYIAEENHGDDGLGNGSQVIMGNTSGATPTIKLPFVVIEHRGGTAFCGLANSSSNIMNGKINATPFNRFLLPNVTAKLTINYGAKLIGFADLYAGDKHNTTDINLIGSNNDYLINIENGAKVVSKYNPTTKVTDLNIKGSSTINSLKLTVSAGVTANLSTAEVYFPLSWYYNITLSKFESGATATVSSPTQALKILPGCVVTIGYGVTANMKTIFVTQDTSWTEGSGTGSTSYDGNGTSSAKKPGELIVNGTLNVENINGVISTVGSTGRLTINSSVNATSKEVKAAGSDSYSILIVKKIPILTYTELGINESARGAMLNADGSTETKSFAVGMYHAENDYWVSDANSSKYTLQFYDGNTLLSEKVGYFKEGETANITLASLNYVPEKPYFVLSHWTYENNPVDENTTIPASADAVYKFYANWTEQQYYINYVVLDKDNREISTDKYTNSSKLEYSISNPLVLSKVTGKNGTETWLFDGYWYIKVSDTEYQQLPANVSSNNITVDPNAANPPEGYNTLLALLYGTNTKPEKAVTLYTWLRAPVTITYSYYDNNGAITETVKLAQGSTDYTLPDLTSYNTDANCKWYYSDTTWYTDEACTKPFTVGTAINSDISLYAKQPTEKPKITITYDYNGGTLNGANSVTKEIYATVSQGQYEVAIDTTEPTLDNCTFAGWFLMSADNRSGTKISGSYKTANTSFTLIAQWKAHITVSLSNATVVISYSGFVDNSDGTGINWVETTYTGDFDAYRGGQITNVDATFDKDETTLKVGGSNYTDNSGDPYSISGNTTVEASSESSCLVEGTLVTLADGTKKKVEDLTVGDNLLVFNHETGKFDYAKLDRNIHSDLEATNSRIINLVFSDGTVTRIVGEHGFFDLNENKYVFINESNINEFIGHKFYTGKFDGTNYTSGNVTLTDYYVTEEIVRVFNPITFYHLNLFANDLLSMTDIPICTEGIVNIFEYDPDTLQYNQEQMQADIEKYGLLTYEEVSEYLTYDEYLLSPVKYLKISIGKGKLTMEDLKYLIEHGKS